MDCTGRTIADASFLKDKLLYALIMNNVMTIIKTKEFTLRPLSMKDLDGFFETMQDEDTKNALMSFPKTIEEAKEEMQEMLQKVEDGISEIFTVVVDGKYAGSVTLEYQGFKPCDEGRLHITIHPDFRGRGLATNVIKRILDYGFKKRKFKRIFAQCKASNKGVVRVNEKVGFTPVKEHVRQGVKKILWKKEA